MDANEVDQIARRGPFKAVSVGHDEVYADYQMVVPATCRARSYTKLHDASVYSSHEGDIIAAALNRVRELLAERDALKAAGREVAEVRAVNDHWANKRFAAALDKLAALLPPTGRASP